MLRTSYRYLCALAIMLAALTPAAADSALADDTWCTPNYGPYEGYSGVVKVKPSEPPTAQKVKAFSGVASSFRALSSYSPAYWGFNCCLPSPAKGQFVIGPKVYFSRVQGHARRGLDAPGTTATVIDFDDHLGFRKTGHTFWGLDVLYQFRPRWGIHYAFNPMSLEATYSPLAAFTFGGQNFGQGSLIHSKWNRTEHRAGLVFNISRRPNSLTNLYADWVYMQDKLSVAPAGAGATTAVTWDDDKSVALLGLEFQKCLKNYRGNTLSFTGKGGVAFLDDSIGYEAEAGLSYLIPIRMGRFGFVSAGYRYMKLHKERTHRMFETIQDGAFLQAGFLF